jgi:hypothetical protein
VAVENAVAADGARVARVQLTLSAAMRPRVRSARNLIFVEADRLDTDTPSAGTVAAIGPTTTIKEILVQPREGATAVTLRATGPIVPADVYSRTDKGRLQFIQLRDGTVASGHVRCRTHGSVFDLRSGEVRRGPSSCGVPVYRVEIVDGLVRVEVPD